MAGMIAKLQVALQLETAAFEKGTKRAAAQVDEFGTKAEKLGFKIGTLGKAVATGFAAFAASEVVGVVKDLVTSGLEYASSLGEQAQQLGVTAKALQEYRYAASQVGLSNDDMDTALSKLTKTLGQAASGAKGPAKAFADLGINIRDAKGHIIDAGDAIPLIADALAKIPDPAARAKVEVELFGKAGQKLDTLLAGGAASVNNLRDAAHQLGIVLSDKQIQQADDAADKLAAVKQVLEAKIAGVVADNADSILKMANALGELVQKVINLFNALQRFEQSGAGKTLSMINRLSRDVLTGNGADVVAFARDQLSGSAKPAQSAPARSTPYSGVGRRPTTGVSGKLDPSLFLMNPGKFGKVGLTDANPGLFGEFGVGGLDPNFLLNNTTAKSIETLQQEAEDAARALRDAGGAFGEFEDKGVKAAEATKNSFLDAASGITSALSSLSYSIRGGGFLDILGSVIGLATQLGSIGAFGKKVQTSINARANGGPISAGMPYLVGERGPEMIVPSTSGTVIPNHKLAAAGGGETVVRIVPSPHYEAVMDSRVVRAAPAIADGGARLAASRAGRAQSRRLAA